MVCNLTKNFNKLVSPKLTSKPLKLETQNKDKIQKKTVNKAEKDDNNKNNNIFSSPISTDEPPSNLNKKAGQKGVPKNISNDSPLQTNSFYSNMFVDNQDAGVWTHPYSVWYSNKGSYGLLIYHARQNDRVFTGGDPPNAFYYPTGVKELVLSAKDFDEKTEFSVINMSKFAATARFGSKDNHMDAPLVQGMGFVTATYSNTTPQIKSEVAFKSFDKQDSPKDGIDKYRIELQNGTLWSMYVTIPQGTQFLFTQPDSKTILSSGAVSGVVIQLCFDQNDVYDKAAGCYPTDASIEATVDGSNCTYKLNYKTTGGSNSNTTLIFALPHHVDSFTDNTKKTNSFFKLPSTTLGDMTGCLTNSLEMQETLPTDIGFDPYTTIEGKKANFSDQAKSAISSAAKDEANKNVDDESNVNSMYTSGKILAKYALILYTTHFILKDDDTTKKLLDSLKNAIGRFQKNQQQFPLIYDTNFKGIVSSAPQDQDFGNGLYNDHHFHYGYHIHAAAIVAKVDKDLGGNWLDDIKPWINSLARDIANPSSEDKYFPVSRNFDFFIGHSWAKGLFASYDGKDEESTSEDYNHAYALKCWGNVIGDQNLENRGNLMLAILKRALNSYALYKDDNEVEPSKYIPNKVAGISFENKLNYTTYFGNQPEYIHGIHMIPITPVSSFIRLPEFVKQEWNKKLSSVVNNVLGGFRSILELNVALYDPDSSYKFFNDQQFNKEWLDNGLSRTWALAYGAGVGAST